jgi:leucine dehydrogenase
VPVAVGGVLDEDTVLNAPLIVGPANNQLVDDSVAAALAARGIVWVPDCVASAGDVVSALLSDSAARHTTPLAEAAALSGRRLGGVRTAAV